jgi:uncharacterized membrane protein (UPF0127 family)
MENLNNAILFTTACVMLSGCMSTTGCTRSNDLPAGIILESLKGQKLRIEVEVVTSQADQARGLMYREHLDPMAGMLFVYSRESHRKFWMKNTLIPLDLVFIGQNKRIVGIVDKAEPLTETPRAVAALSMYVLEVNGGFMERHGVLSGSQVVFENL